MSLNLQRIQAICFDVDGTLSNTDDRWVQRFQDLLKPLAGLFPQRDTYKFARRIIMELENPGNLLYELLDRLKLDDQVGRLFSALSQHNKSRQQDFLLVPGVDNLLANLVLHWPMAVVSARDERSTLEFLNQFGLTPYFKTIVTALTCPYTKPFPDPIHWATRQMGVAAENCLMVGDTTVDIRAGKAAGAQTVGVLCGFGSRRELERAGADIILETTADLGPLLTYLHAQAGQPATGA